MLVDSFPEGTTGLVRYTNEALMAYLNGRPCSDMEYMIQERFLGLHDPKDDGPSTSYFSGLGVTGMRVPSSIEIEHLPSTMQYRIISATPIDPEIAGHLRSGGPSRPTIRYKKK